MESFWDAAYRAGEHLEHWERPGEPAELGELVAALPEGAVALDVGCGAGLEAIYLARRGLRVIGVDASGAGLELARERAEAVGVVVDWRRGDARALPVAAGSVALALDRGCLHVIERESRGLYATEIERVLAPGGRFLLCSAREDDDEGGVVGVTAEEVDRLFPPSRFRRGPLEEVILEARAGGLPAHRVLLEKTG